MKLLFNILIILSILEFIFLSIADSDNETTLRYKNYADLSDLLVNLVYKGPVKLTFYSNAF